MDVEGHNQGGSIHYPSVAPVRLVRFLLGGIDACRVNELRADTTQL